MSHEIHRVLPDSLNLIFELIEDFSSQFRFFPGVAKFVHCRHLTIYQLLFDAWVEDRSDSTDEACSEHHILSRFHAHHASQILTLTIRQLCKYALLRMPPDTHRPTHARSQETSHPLTQSPASRWCVYECISTSRRARAPTLVPCPGAAY